MFLPVKEQTNLHSWAEAIICFTYLCFSYHHHHHHMVWINRTLTQCSSLRTQRIWFIYRSFRSSSISFQMGCSVFQNIVQYNLTCASFRCSINTLDTFCFLLCKKKQLGTRKKTIFHSKFFQYFINFYLLFNLWKWNFVIALKKRNFYINA